MQKIYIDENGFYAAGEAVWAWIQQQPEIDHNTMGVQGVSMGSIWGTQVASVIPTVKGCAIGYPSYEQGENRAFNMYSPSFKLRFMFMAGYEDETEFDVFIQKINSHGLGAKVTFPYLVIGGEDDDFASIESTFDVLNEVNAPKEYLLYQGEGHTLHSRPSSYAGPSEWSYIADWMCDRFKGKPMESTLSVVDYTGRVHRTPWGDRRDYEPGLPDLG
jgi:dienelactone hydrolase